jgi:hypothetical protein
VLQKVDERIARAVRKNAALDADRYKTFAGKLEYFDLRELQDTIAGKEPWAQFEPRFGAKEALNVKFDQLAELRHGIRHSRAVSEVIRKEVKRRSFGSKQVLQIMRAAMMMVYATGPIDNPINRGREQPV